MKSFTGDILQEIRNLFCPKNKLSVSLFSSFVILDVSSEIINAVQLM